MVQGTQYRTRRDMALLDEAIEASGGLTRWNEFRRFTLQLSIEGELLSRAGQAGLLKNVVAEGSTHCPSVRFSGFADPGKSYLYQPDQVTIESPEGNVLRSWRDPAAAFSNYTGETRWDELALVFFCGFSVWNCLMTPFVLAHPDMKVEEMQPWSEQDQEWRRLRAQFPQGSAAPSLEQTFYFDAAGLQRRVDQDFFGTTIAQYSWAHQAFGAMVIPTLRRALIRRPDGKVVAKPVLLDVEIFDATFE